MWLAWLMAKVPPLHINTSKKSIQARVQTTICSTTDVYAWQAITAAKYHGLAFKLHLHTKLWLMDRFISYYFNIILEVLQTNLYTTMRNIFQRQQYHIGFASSTMADSQMQTDGFQSSQVFNEQKAGTRAGRGIKSTDKRSSVKVLEMVKTHKETLGKYARNSHKGKDTLAQNKGRQN